MAVTFELDYNGIQFLKPTPELLERVKNILPAVRRLPFRYYMSGDPNLDYGIPSVREPFGEALYELFIPTSASRWAVFRGFMHTSDVATLTGTGTQSVYYLSGIPTLQVGTLNVSVDGVTTIKRYMYMLPPMPLTGIGTADLYLVTLVDARYFAQFGSVASGSGGGTTWTTWNNWNTLITNSLAQSGATGAAYPGGPSGAPLTYGTWPPESQYGQPELDSDFYAFAGAPGVIADAALAATGRVLCGDYTVIKWADANTFATTARATNASDRRAGGVLWPQHQSGSTELPLVAHLPASVTVQFPWWVQKAGYRPVDAWTGAHTDDIDPRVHAGDGEYGYNYSLNYTPSALGSPYSSLVFDATTTGDTLNLKTTAKATYTQDFTFGPTNLTSLQNLAQQLAKDFYDSQQQSVTETYRGLVAFDYKAAYDVVYSFWPEPMTRISRRPLNEYPTRFGHGLGDISAPHRVQICQVTGAISGGYYPAVIAPAGLSTSVTVSLYPTNGETLYNGINYPAIRAQTAYTSSGASAIPVYYTAIPPASATGLSVNSTSISGGSAGNVLYTDGSLLQAASGADISSGSLWVQLAASKWVSFGVGSF